MCTADYVQEPWEPGRLCLVSGGLALLLHMQGGSVRGFSSTRGADAGALVPAAE
jgi:hypothetical protein